MGNQQLETGLSVGKAMRYAFLDGLRGFAALWVVFYHIFNRFYPGITTQNEAAPGGLPADAWDASMTVAFGLGYSGVTLFFVLSGLCIHLPQAKRRTNFIEIRSFASRRFWRLYPAYVASIAFTVFALALPKLLLLAGGKSFDWVTELRLVDAAVSLGFLQPAWPSSLTFNGVYWTLVYEVQFYAMYPILLWMIRRAGLIPTGIVLFASELWFSYHVLPYPCFFGARYFEWFLGLIAAEWMVRGIRSSQVMPIIALAIAGLSTGATCAFVPEWRPLRDLAFAIGYFGLLLAIASRRLGLLNTFENRYLVWCGIVSYSLYLNHVLVIDLMWVGLDRLAVPRIGGAMGHRLVLLAIPASIAMAYLSYLLFEEPFLKQATRDRPQKTSESVAGDRTTLVG